MNMIQALESRRLMAIDFSLTGLSATNFPTRVEQTKTGDIYSTIKVSLNNKGLSTVFTTTPAVGVTFTLHPTTGSDVTIGTISAKNYNGLKGGATRALSLSVRLPVTGVPVADYTLVATLTGESAIAGSNPGNNTATGNKLTVINSGAQLFAAYGFSDRVKFTKVTSSTVSGMLTEEGTFVDANHVTGTYSYKIAPPQQQSYAYTLSMTATGKAKYTISYTTVSKSPISLDGRTGSFNKNTNGGVKATGSRHSFGTTVYFLTSLV